MHCQKCGKKLKPGEKFCSICGFYNSEEEMIEESDNWNDISTGDEIEIDDDDSEKWFEDDEDITVVEDETQIKAVEEKESFWSKKKKEKEAKKAQQEIENAERKAKEEQERKEREEIKKQKEQEKEYQKALEQQVKDEISYKTENRQYDSDDDIEERFLKAYIGEDYQKIRFKKFNILAALLNWAYVIYRKLYITGIIGLIITEIVVLKYQKIAPFYAVFVILILGLFFNNYYLFISKIKIKNIQKKFEGSDNYSMEKILSQKGGVNVIITLLLYLVFLIVLFYGMFHFKINKSHNTKFWEENTNNAANCISLTKTSYNYLPNVDINGQIVESSCKIQTLNGTKEYAIYMKLLSGTKTIYAYFQTENSYLQYRGNTQNMDELELKYKNNSLSPEEKQLYNELKSIQLTHEDISEKSKEEEKLIEEKKNTKERANYLFTKEEITR